MPSLISRRAMLALAGTACLGPTWAAAQGKPVTIIVPYAPGGSADLVTRVIAQFAAPGLGSALVVDNRTGGGGVVGWSAAARAAPDGQTLLTVELSYAIAAGLMPNLPFDPRKAFTQVTTAVKVPHVLVVNPQVQARSVGEFIALARAQPGKLNYGSGGNGTNTHLAGELFKLQTNTFITHIPYRGAGPALQDLIAGNVDMMFDGLGSSAQHIKSGRIRALMVSGDKRNPAFPDVPCAAESGLPDYTVTTWYGLWAPKGTPQAVQAQVIDQVQRIGSAEEIKSIWARNGADYGGMNQQQFAAMVHGEIVRWAQVVKASGAKLE
ncbi:MAG TPA: ABC transporter substrate-binding protein [Delftia acidovorans]|nr:ABC transporter substrate-binding protein [Delftia acidovorans]